MCISKLPLSRSASTSFNLLLNHYSDGFVRFLYDFFKFYNFSVVYLFVCCVRTLRCNWASVSVCISSSWVYSLLRTCRVLLYIFIFKCYLPCSPVSCFSSFCFYTLSLCVALLGRSIAMNSNYSAQSIVLCRTVCIGLYVSDVTIVCMYFYLYIRLYFT